MGSLNRNIAQTNRTSTFVSQNIYLGPRGGGVVNHAQNFTTISCDHRANLVAVLSEFIDVFRMS